MFGPFWISDGVILCRTFGLNAFDEGRGSKCCVVSDPQVPIDPS